MPIIQNNQQFIVTAKLINLACPETKIADQWATHFNEWLPIYKINTKADACMMLAQCGHESSGFTKLTENMNYSAKGLLKTFPKYYKTVALANAHARKPILIANHVYQNRMGNIQAGDGYKFKGLGIIQMTGRQNHEAFGKTIGMNADQVRQYIETANGMVRAACWFWNVNKLSIHQNNVEKVTLIINGADKGLFDRKARYSRVINS